MQNAALEVLGLADEWSYGALDVEPAEFADRVRKLPEEGYVGVNVTIPHKRAALELSDQASEAAREIGAANTLSFADGQIRAENTDATGLLSALRAPPAGKTALVLGAGGSARAAAWTLADRGASVSVWNRTSERAEELASDVGGAAAEGRVAAVGEREARAGSFDLIVNCTAVGMGEEDPFEQLPLDPERFAAGITVVDLVYAGGESRLVREARERGAQVVDGLEVLVQQGAESLRLWTGMSPPLDVMRDAVRQDPREEDDD